MDYKELSQRIRETFTRHVIPGNVLHVFNKYDRLVLTQNDIEKVKAWCNNHGNIEAANELLNRLIIYKDWFRCLLKVLRDEDVKLGHVADEFQQIFERLKEESNQELEADVAEMVAQEESKVTKHIKKEPKAPMNNDSLLPWNPSMKETTGGAQSASEPQYASQTFVKDILPQSSEHFRQSELSHHMDNLKLHPTTSTHQSSLASLDDPWNMSVTSVRASSRSSFRFEDDAVLPPDGHSQSSLSSLQIVIPNNRSGMDKSVTSGLPERNFGREEVYYALRYIPGWCEIMTSSEIRRVLTPHLETSGYYVIWFWEKHARPAISFTLNGEIATLIFHKRQATDTRTEMEFYLTKDSKMFGSLKEMAEYCLAKGVIAKTDQGSDFRVTFKFPVESKK